MDTEKSLVAWINTNGLSRKVRGLTDLADMRLLYELLTQIAPAYFHSESLVLDTLDQRTALLLNLRNFYSSTSDYYETVFHTNVELIVRDLNLSAIAEQPTTSNMLPLLELVIAMAVKCSSNQTYISRMWNLPTSAQEQMMVFIQRVLDKFDRPEADAAELTHAFKVDKRSLQADFDFVKTELIRTARKLDNALSDRSTLKASLNELESDLRRKVGSRTTAEIDSLLRMEYESQLSQKNDEIEELKQQFTRSEAKNAQEIRRLKDELDVQTERIQQLSALEATNENYKKRLEEVPQIKRQVKELLATKADLQAQLKKTEETESHFAQLQHSVSLLKEQLKQEKEKNAHLNYQLSQKEVLLAEADKVVKEKDERLAIMAERTDERDSRLSEFGRVSESASLQRDLVAELEERVRQLTSENTALKTSRGDDTLVKLYSEQADSALAERQKAEELLLLARRKVDDLEKEAVESGRKLESLQTDFDALLTEKNSLEESLKVAQTELNEKKALQTQVAELKGKCENLQAALKSEKQARVSEESKVQAANSTTQALSVALQAVEGQNALLRSEVTHYQLKIKEMSEAEKLLVQEIESFKNYKPEMTQSQGQTIKLLEAERELTRLRCDVSSLSLNLQDKDALISTLSQDQEKVATKAARNVEDLKAKHTQEIASLQAKSQSLKQELISLKAKHKDFLEDWRREQVLVAMAVHSIGLELCQQRFRAGVKT